MGPTISWIAIKKKKKKTIFKYSYQTIKIHRVETLLEQFDIKIDGVKLQKFWTLER